MSIFGIGAYYEQDVSADFIKAGIAGAGWADADAPDVHRFLRALKVGDIVYIKASRPGASEIRVKAIGLVADDDVLDAVKTNNLVEIGRRIRWVDTIPFSVPKLGKNNVRSNTIYEEYHPEVQQEIMRHLLAALPAKAP